MEYTELHYINYYFASMAAGKGSPILKLVCSDHDPGLYLLYDKRRVPAAIRSIASNRSILISKSNNGMVV